MYRSSSWLAGFFLCGAALTSPICADDSVLISDNTYSQEHASEIHELIGEYVQAVVYNDLIKKTSEIVSEAIQQNNLPLMPDLAYYAIYKMVVALFDQEDTQKTIRDLYNETYDKAIEDYDKDVPPDKIQQTVEDDIQAKLEPIYDGEIYHQIVEQILKMAVKEQQMIIAQQVIKQKVRQYVIQREMMQRVIQQRIQEYARLAYQQAVQNAVQQRYRQVAQQYAEQAMRQQYEQAIERYKQAAEQQYQQAIQKALQGRR